jgi:hypothetical protein
VDTLISKIVDLLKASPSVWAALTIAGLCVVIPSRWQHVLGLDELRAHYLPWITLATIVFASLLLMSLCSKAHQAIRRRRNRKCEELEAVEAAREAESRLVSHISALTPNERLILAYFVVSRQQTLELSTIDNDVDRLIQRGMLQRFQQIPNAFRVAHAIEPGVYAFLDQNRSLIGAEWRELERRSKAGEPWH